MALKADSMSERVMFFLKPWKPLSHDGAKYFEAELARELAPHHPLHGHQCNAIAITVKCDDVLYRVDDGTFAQVQLTYTRNPPERPGWPGHDVFDTLADWMLDKMLRDHVEHFDLWPDGW
jgi:hypothetical protein